MNVDKRATDKKRWIPVHIHAQVESHVPRLEPGDWALEITGSISATENAEDRVANGSDAEIGVIKAFLIQMQEARHEGLDASAVLNAKSFATSEYSQLFKDAQWKRRVSKKFEPRSADLLILDEIELKPEYRGYGLGLLASRCLIEMFGSRCGLVACKPYPLQFEGSTTGLRKARKKLRRYWTRLGFRRVPRTTLYALDPEKSLPKLGQMLRAKTK